MWFDHYTSRHPAAEPSALAMQVVFPTVHIDDHPEIARTGARGRRSE